MPKKELTNDADSSWDTRDPTNLALNSVSNAQMVQELCCKTSTKNPSTQPISASTRDKSQTPFTERRTNWTRSKQTTCWLTKQLWSNQTETSWQSCRTMWMICWRIRFIMRWLMRYLSRFRRKIWRRSLTTIISSSFRALWYRYRDWRLISSMVSGRRRLWRKHRLYNRKLRKMTEARASLRLLRKAKD